MSAKINDGLTRSQRYYRRHRQVEIARKAANRRANLPHYAALAASYYRADPAKHRARKRAEYAANPVPFRERVRVRRANDPLPSRAAAKHRVRKMEAAFVEPVSLFVLLERQDGACGICGLDIAPGDAVMDHILSLAGGGEHSYENTQAAHRSCNASKGSR